MKRCNSPATRYSRYNGFKTCETHYRKLDRKGAILMKAASGHPIGACDQPVETREQFRRRLGLS